MNLSVAISKLHDILRVLIGECADELQSQKPISKYKTDCEWVQHLLYTHKISCSDADCLSHNTLHAENETFLYKSNVQVIRKPETTHSCSTLSTPHSKRKNRRNRFRPFLIKSRTNQWKQPVNAVQPKTSHPIITAHTQELSQSNTGTSIIADACHSISEYENEINSTKLQAEYQCDVSLSEIETRVDVKREAEEVITLLSDDNEVEDENDDITDFPDQCPSISTNQSQIGVDKSPWETSTLSVQNKDGSCTIYGGGGLWQITESSSEAINFNSNEYDCDQVIKQEVEDFEKDSSIPNLKAWNGRDSFRGNNRGVPCYSSPEHREKQDSYHKSSSKRKCTCVYCKQMFSNIYSLRQHVNLHFSIHPYRCDLCNLSFSRLSTLYNHRLKHGNRSMQCPYCLWKSNSNRLMYYHLKRCGNQQ